MPKALRLSSMTPRPIWHSARDRLAIRFKYSIPTKWNGCASDLPWSDRWDVYLIGSPDDDIHYFAIVNSLMVVLFLTGAIATIMIRTLRKDISGYNEMQTLEEAQEETGWKLVHGDVFRPPQTNPVAQCLVGTGAQIGAAFLMCAQRRLCVQIGTVALSHLARIDVLRHPLKLLQPHE